MEELSPEKEEPQTNHSSKSFNIVKSLFHLLNVNLKLYCMSSYFLIYSKNISITNVIIYRIK